jgi:tRNA A37 threonylcarbamoyladenosine modification protein TsaB
MLCLCADSSGSVLSFSLADVEAHRLLYTVELPSAKGSDGVFFPLLEDFLKKAGTSPQKIDRWAAIVGPGSFTGIRICLSGLSAVTAALGKRLEGLSALDAAALLSGLEKVSVAARLRLDEYARRDYDFKKGHSDIYLCGDTEGALTVNNGAASAYTNLSSAIAEAGCELFLREPEPLYVIPSQAEINFDKKSFHR